MDSELGDLARQGNYSELLIRSSDLLASSQGNPLALEYKGRALASLLRYEEACEVLQAAIYAYESSACVFGVKDNSGPLKQFEKYCRRICAIASKLDFTSGRLNAFPSDWYESRLLETVEKQDKESQSVGYNSKLEHIAVNCLEPGLAYIIEPESEANKFSGQGTSVYYRLAETLGKYPLVQGDKQGYIYMKSQSYKLGYERQKYWKERSELQPVAVFPTVHWEDIGAVTQPSQECDVWYSTRLVDATAQRLLTWSLDKLAKERQDFFVPMYHNIIDPNLTAMKDDTGVYKWTATDFVIEEVRIPKMEIVIAIQGCVKRIIGRGLPWHSIELILSFNESFLFFGKAHLASPLPDLPFQDNKELAVAIETVMTAACPLLAKLCKPAILLPGKLQAVIKAQSIYLNPGEEYTGVWHSDGLNEHIVAVVIYYYRFSPGIEGGDLEFISRRPRQEEFWLGGDCDPSSMTPEEIKPAIDELPHCRVPMQQGCLAVFSNYQLVHRVLTMRNNSQSVVSRDFLVLFIVDQRVPLESTLSLATNRTRIADKQTRSDLFFEQLTPQGKFGVYDDLVYSTGNGSVALLGWMDKNRTDADTINYHSTDRRGLKALQAMSKSPPLGRGLSWALEECNWEKSEQEDEYQEELIDDLNYTD